MSENASSTPKIIVYKGHKPYNPSLVTRRKRVCEVVFTHGPIFNAAEVSATEAGVCNVSGATL